jgi:Insertion element 4 transposase N-terminal/Transposase DDE domain
LPVQCATPEVRLAALTCEVTPELVDEVIETAGCRERRRRLLPARAVVYFVLGLCLFSGADSERQPGYRSVMRSMSNGLRHLCGAVLPSGPALAKARARLGSKPLELLFDRCRGPRAAAGTPGAFAFGRRIVSWDGTALDVPRTAANLAAFGVPSGGWQPAVRLMALIEDGTRSAIDAAFDSYTGASEIVLARRLLHALERGMVLLADRNFPGWELWGLAAAGGADLVWRVPGNRVLVPVAFLPDGSYLSVMPTPAEARGGWNARQRDPGRVPRGYPVRVIRYTVTVRPAQGGTPRTQTFRLVTTLLDPDEAPAADIAALYHQRWESENGYQDLKTRLRGAGFILRSRSPDLICQEIYALLTLYQALSATRADAAGQAGIDPDKISFTVTLRVIRDQVSGNDTFTTPAALAHAHREAITDLLTSLLPRRRDRQYQRARRSRRSKYPALKRNQPRPPANIAITITIDPPAPSSHPPPGTR